MVVWSEYLVDIHQVEMVGQEIDHDPHEDDSQNVRNDPDDELADIAELLIFELSSEQHQREDTPEHAEDSHEKGVNNQQHERFSILEADAIAEPRAVVVHHQHTALACRAVMSPFGFEHLADETVSAISTGSM